MINKFKIVYGLILISCFFSTEASEYGKLYFNYSNMSLISNGIYNPKVDGEKTVLNAELIARKNGMDNLEKYIETSCAGLDKSSLDVKPDWENNFHSQKTEIYSDGVLAVSLKGQIKQVFKTSTKLRKILQTNDHEKIVFDIPSQIPISAIRCGLLQVNLGNNNMIHVIPMDSIEPSEAKTKKIHLIFNAKVGYLQLDPAFHEMNSELIKSSKLAKYEEISSEILPILVSVQSNEKE